MSSIVLYRYVGPEFERERYKPFDKVAQWLYEVDNAPDETGFRSKIKRFWKRTRIHSVVKKVVEESKSWLSRLASRLTPDATPPESDHSGKNTAARATEQPNVPQGNSASPVASSGTVSPWRNPTTLEEKPLDSPVQSAGSIFKPAEIDHLPTDDPDSRADTANEKTFSTYRYKEKEHGKQLDFPEIEIGVVSARAKWLEPILSGEMEPVQALEISDLDELAHNWSEEDSDQSRNDGASDEESIFDDSPRLFKHRLPKEEPEPWVEPGAVAKGAMSLQPVLSGEKRARSGDSEQGNLASPTRVSHGMFL